MDGILLSWPFTSILALLELLLDSLVRAFDLICLSLELILDHFLLLELVYQLVFFLFNLSCYPFLFNQARLQVLNAHSDAVSLVFAEEWLRCDVTNGTLDIVTCILSVFELSLNVNDFLRLQLVSEVFLLNSLILLVNPSELLLHFHHVVLRLLEDCLIVLEVALQSLHFALHGPHLALHVQNLSSNLISATLAHRASILGDCFLEILLKLECFALVYGDLGAQVLGFILVPLGHLAVRHCKFALNVRILVIFGKSTLMQWTSCHLLGQTSLDNIQFSHLFPNLIILILQILTLIFQVSLHIAHIIITKFVSHASPRLYHGLYTPQLGCHHCDLLAQEVLFLLQSVILTLEFNDLVFLIGRGEWHALSLAVVTPILRWNAQVTVV